MKNLIKIKHDGLLNNSLIIVNDCTYVHDFKNYKAYAPYYITFISEEIEHTDLNGYADILRLNSTECSFPDLWVGLADYEEYGMLVYNDYVLAEITKDNLIYLYTDYMEVPFLEIGDLIYKIMDMYEYVDMTEDCIIFRY